MDWMEVDHKGPRVLEMINRLADRGVDQAHIVRPTGWHLNEAAGIAPYVNLAPCAWWNKIIRLVSDSDAPKDRSQAAGTHKGMAANRNRAGNQLTAPMEYVASPVALAFEEGIEVRVQTQLVF